MKDSKFYTSNEIQATVNSANNINGSDKPTMGPINDGQVFQLFHEELGRPIVKDFNARKLKAMNKLGFVQEPLITF